MPKDTTKYERYSRVEKFATDDHTTSQALQQLARGSHWWQPEQGIPYLLSVGAKPALCIGIAFRSSNTFAKEAVLALLNGGTDIHSESNEDNGCSTLEMAASSAHAYLEIVQRILSTGVPITATTLFAATCMPSIANLLGVRGKSLIFFRGVLLIWRR